MWGLEPSQQCEIFFGLIVLQLVGCPPVDTGFDFIMVVPLLPFSCVFSFVLGCGVSFFFFGGSQCLPVNGCSTASCDLVLRQEKMSTYPSTSPA